MPIESEQPRRDEEANGIQPEAFPSSLPVVAPDAGEEEVDDVVPTRGYRQLPVVGLGGSAGGIQALKSFFAALPPGVTGVAYVVILHLSPEHASTLPELLQGVTSLPVKAAEDGEPLQPDHVYVIPPAKHLTLTDGHLRLTRLEPERGKRVAVDLFFRSLADTHGPHAVAIVLSGADSDGAIGIKRVKERGGLTIAQDPGEADQDSMPRASIDTGMVDWVLPVADMSGRLLRYCSSENLLRLPPEEGPQPAKPAPPTPNQDEQALRDVLGLLRTRTGRDFTYYKRATILRRVARRMQINEAATLPAYLDFLRTHSGETGALLQDLLVSVTNFFRDREAFAVVEERIPTLFAGKGAGDTVRVWSAACATGEEAYSLAMLLHEHARQLEHPPTVQVFGCDLDERAIQTARAGLYPATIAADVSEERLQRFFTREARGYRVRRELRETVLFTQHDLLKDAPFSRMDLVSCRNLLIYLDTEAQARALEVFHFALKPDGLLFLGSAESVDEEKTLFAMADKKHCLFVRRATARVGLPVPAGTSRLVRALQAQIKEAPSVPPAALVRDVAGPFASPSRQPAEEGQAGLAELHFKLTERYAPPSLIVNAEGDIVHLSENVGRFLRPSGGLATTNFLQMVLPALRMDLRAALLRMEETHAPVELLGLAVELEEGVSRLVDLRVVPAAELAPGYVLVSFAARNLDTAVAAVAASTPADAEVVVRHLERELEAARARLRDTVERSHASDEEYKSSNEELQSMNEELRSASEELETSREELQSLNEELNTVNAELRHNVAEVGHANNDLHNLMNATAIATVFLDRELKVLRYTPFAVPLFNLIPSDAGRPLGHLKHQVDYPDLEADAREVLRTLVPMEREVVGPGNSWLLVRLLPYRSLDDRIEGVVLTFVDITERKHAEEIVQAALRTAEQARGEAEAANAAKDHFLAVLSHELRTPLMPITIALAALDRREDLPEPIRKAHEMIRRNVDLEARFIDDMLDVTRIARGKMEIARAPMDLHTALERAVEVSSSDLEAKGQGLTVALAADEHTLSGDFARLQQVFWNLLKNAAKFTPAGGAIGLRSHNEAGNILVGVTDNGIGMEAEALQRIFAPFEQANVSIAQEFGGLGLGLAIARATVQAHGGSLYASSPGLGRGATFIVSLPLAAGVGVSG